MIVSDKLSDIKKIYLHNKMSTRIIKQFKGDRQLYNLNSQDQIYIQNEQQFLECTQQVRNQILQGINLGRQHFNFSNVLKQKLNQPRLNLRDSHWIFVDNWFYYISKQEKQYSLDDNQIRSFQYYDLHRFKYKSLNNTPKPNFVKYLKANPTLGDDVAKKTDQLQLTDFAYNPNIGKFYRKTSNKGQQTLNLLRDSQQRYVEEWDRKNIKYFEDDSQINYVGVDQCQRITGMFEEQLQNGQIGFQITELYEQQLEQSFTHIQDIYQDQIQQSQRYNQNHDGIQYTQQLFSCLNPDGGSEINPKWQAIQSLKNVLKDYFQNTTVMVYLKLYIFSSDVENTSINTYLEASSQNLVRQYQKRDKDFLQKIAIPGLPTSKDIEVFQASTSVLTTRIVPYNRIEQKDQNIIKTQIYLEGLTSCFYNVIYRKINDRLNQHYNNVEQELLKDQKMFAVKQKTPRKFQSIVHEHTDVTKSYINKIRKALEITTTHSLKNENGVSEKEIKDFCIESNCSVSIYLPSGEQTFDYKTKHNNETMHFKLLNFPYNHVDQYIDITDTKYDGFTFIQQKFYECQDLNKPFIAKMMQDKKSVKEIYADGQSYKVDYNQYNLGQEYLEQNQFQNIDNNSQNQLSHFLKIACAQGENIRFYNIDKKTKILKNISGNQLKLKQDQLYQFDSKKAYFNSTKNKYFDKIGLPVNISNFSPCNSILKDDKDIAYPAFYMTDLNLKKFQIQIIEKNSLLLYILSQYNRICYIPNLLQIIDVLSKHVHYDISQLQIFYVAISYGRCFKHLPPDMLEKIDTYTIKKDIDNKNKIQYEQVSMYQQFIGNQQSVNEYSFWMYGGVSEDYAKVLQLNHKGHTYYSQDDWSAIQTIDKYWQPHKMYLAASYIQQSRIKLIDLALYCFENIKECDIFRASLDSIYITHQLGDKIQEDHNVKQKNSIKDQGDSLGLKMAQLYRGINEFEDYEQEFYGKIKSNKFEQFQEYLSRNTSFNDQIATEKQDQKFPIKLFKDNQEVLCNSLHEFNCKTADDRILFLIGEGGTGKTHYALNNKHNQKILYLAPSHRLKSEMQQKYGHLGIQFDVHQKYYIGQNKKESYALKIAKTNIQTVYIDEGSILNKNDILKLFQIFWDKKIIVIMDHLQLLPVEGMMINYKKYTYAEFQHQHRITDEKLIQLKDKLRFRISKNISENIKEELIQLNRGITLQQMYEQIKAEDRILAFKHTTKDKITKHIIDNLNTLQTKDNQQVRLYCVQKNQNDYYKGDIVFEKPKGIQVQEQYAFTCHSMQGQTAPGKIYIIDDNVPQRFGYVAVTRAKTLNDIYIISDIV